MAKGDGSITEVRRGVWRVRIDFGTDPVTGKRAVVSRNVHGSKADARKVRDRIRQEHDSGLSFEAATVTFGEFAQTWQDARVASGELSLRTIKDGEYMVACFSKYLGSVRLADIDPHTVESLYAAIRKDKTDAGRPVNGTTMHKFHVVLKQIMQKAVDHDLILRNPCDRVKAPKKHEPERRSLTLEESARLLRCVDEAEAEAYAALKGKEARQTERGNLFGRSAIHGLYPICNVLAVRIGLATGMRLGEVMGLVWGGVDLNQPCIHVVQQRSTYGEIKPPKGRCKKRTVFIDAATAAHLEKWKGRQAVELLKIGVRQDDSTPVCCSDIGGFYNVQNFERWWRPWREARGFDGLKFHELRHTQATQLLANGVDVKTVQNRLGHSDASLTLNWYAHALPENDRKAADMIGELFAAKPESTPIIEVRTA
ncbi:tyrosine-type recombinase/integrase [Eggerthella sinensis]|uniref:tyrosine-type recombinase/integrase n=1 Tax=Eggerthella sinensis TaxID=242230 RepID=UPI00248E0BB8|nr:tyrosine-type recombinase/integrase [Eggerthella sinensis]